MAPDGMDLGQDGHVDPVATGLQGRPHSGQTGADDYYVMLRQTLLLESRLILSSRLVFIQ
jgi:hypothetical protein